MQVRQHNHWSPDVRLRFISGGRELYGGDTASHISGNTLHCVATTQASTQHQHSPAVAKRTQGRGSTPIPQTDWVRQLSLKPSGKSKWTCLSLPDMA